MLMRGHRVGQLRWVGVVREIVRFLSVLRLNCPCFVRGYRAHEGGIVSEKYCFHGLLWSWVPQEGRSYLW